MSGRSRRFVSVVVAVAVAGGAQLLAAPLARAADGSVLPPSAAVAKTAPRAATLSSELRAVLEDKSLAHSTVGLQVRDARTGRALFGHRATESMKPASNLKLMTAAAALQRLGSGFRFHTDVRAKRPGAGGVVRGNIFLKGYGDPTTLASDYQALANRVRAAGISRVAGDLVVDASYFDEVRFNRFWDPDDASEYYSAQISALTVAPNEDYDAGTIIVNYAPAGVGKPARITVEPAAAARYVTIVNSTTTVKSDRSDTFSYSRDPGTNTIRVSGSVPADGGSREWVTVNDPKRLAGVVFRSALRAAGVRVTGRIVAGRAPLRVRRVARDWSSPLSQIMVPFLKLSNNMHAEHLVKTMGAEVTGNPGSWRDGLRVLRVYMRSQGIPMTGVRLVDGSGLAHANRLTANAIGVGLVKFRGYAALYNGLPVAGNPDRFVGGSLRNRMVGTPAANNLRGKTGTLTGVTSLSGYVTGADGRRYVFSMLISYKNGSAPLAAQDRLGVTLASYPR